MLLMQECSKTVSARLICCGSIAFFKKGDMKLCGNVKERIAVIFITKIREIGEEKYLLGRSLRTFLMIGYVLYVVQENRCLTSFRNMSLPINSSGKFFLGGVDYDNDWRDIQM